MCSPFSHCLSVLPVLQPKLVDFIEEATIYIEESLTNETLKNITLPCSVSVGLGAEVYWLGPNNTAINVYSNLTDVNLTETERMYVIAKDVSVGDYEKVSHRTLTILEYSDVSEIIGKYLCVVHDKGYADHTVFTEYNVTLLPLTSSVSSSIFLKPSSSSATIFLKPSSSSTSSSVVSKSLSSSSSNFLRSFSSSDLPSPSSLLASLPANKFLIITLAISGVCLILILITTSLIIATTIYIKVYRQKKYIPEVSNKYHSNGQYPSAPNVTCMFEYKNTATTGITVPRDHIIFIESLGKKINLFVFCLCWVVNYRYPTTATICVYN